MTFALIAQASQPGASGIVGFLPFIAILVIVWFLMLRPQMKRQKEHTKMLAAVKRGDDIVAAGGLHGRVVAINERDNTLQVQVAKGIVVIMERSAVARLKGSGSPEPTVEPRQAGADRRRTEVPFNREPQGSSGVSAVITTTPRPEESRDGGESSEARRRHRRPRRRKPRGPGGGAPSEPTPTTETQSG